MNPALSEAKVLADQGLCHQDFEKSVSVALPALDVPTVDPTLHLGTELRGEVAEMTGCNFQGHLRGDFEGLNILW